MATRRVNPFGDDDDLDDYGSAWGAPQATSAAPDATISGFSTIATSDILKDTLRKEEVIK